MSSGVWCFTPGSVAKKVRIQVPVESNSITPRSPQLLPDAKKGRTDTKVSLNGDQIMEIQQACVVKSIP